MSPAQKSRKNFLFQCDIERRRKILANSNAQIWGLAFIPTTQVSAAIPIPAGFTSLYATATMLNRGPVENSCFAALATARILRTP
jgi:hypothetical protein